MTKSEKAQHICIKCGHKGPDDEFRTPHVKGKDGHPYWDLCKPCHVNGARASRYRVLYNITVEEYDKILAFQNGRCAICGKVARVTQNRLAVDHCHKSGLIRGILCWHCNRAIGSFGDDQGKIWMAFLYLFAPPAVAALRERRYGLIGRIKKKAKNRVYGSPEFEQEIYRMNPDKFLQQLKLKSMEMQEAALEPKEESPKLLKKQTSLRPGNDSVSPVSKTKRTRSSQLDCLKGSDRARPSKA